MCKNRKLVTVADYQIHYHYHMSLSLNYRCCCWPKKIQYRSGYNTRTHTLGGGIGGGIGGVQWSVGLHPLLSHPSSTVCESLLWPRHCEFDECSTSALLNHWDSVWEASLPGSNGHCSTPLTHNHTYTQTLRASARRRTLRFASSCEDKQCIRAQTRTT